MSCFDLLLVSVFPGYATHMVGKWHLGFFEWKYTPTYRGFDSHYGFYTGCGDHYKHERLGILDLRDNTSPVRDMNGTYSANLFTKVRKMCEQSILWNSFKRCFRLLTVNEKI